MSGIWGKAYASMKLPDGTETKDRAVYHREWDKLISLLESIFTGYKVHCYDPGFMLSHPNINRSLEITAHAAYILRDSFESQKKGKKK